MNYILFLVFSLVAATSNAQNPIQEQINSRLVDLHDVNNNDENFKGYEQIKNEIGDAHIVMLGEQSHTDATTFETKIKLIKFLHQEMDFEILAFESNIYECKKAWEMIQEGHDVRDAIAKGINPIWSTRKELNPLFQYMEQQTDKESPLMIAGFDPQFVGKIAPDFFTKDLAAYLATFENVSVYEKEIQELQSFINTTRKLKKVKKKKATRNVATVQKFIKLIGSKQNDELSEFWIRILENFKICISDFSLGTNDRDLQMAANLLWIREKHPDKKIICWGATSHFLYNSSLIKMEGKKIKRAVGDYYLDNPMMGDYIKNKCGDDVYTIGFIAYEGTYGFNRTITIEAPSKNSLEYLIGNSPNNNYFLSLQNLQLEGYSSRPLGHQSMTNDIAQVMDAVIFNRYMRKPSTDWDFLKYLVPENKISAKKVERIKQSQAEDKQIE